MTRYYPLNASARELFLVAPGCGRPLAAADPQPRIDNFNLSTTSNRAIFPLFVGQWLPGERVLCQATSRISLPMLVIRNYVLEPY